MAVIATVDVPVFARVRDEEIEIGTVTLDIDPDRTPKENHA